jgi:hypothetical protein
MHLSKGGQSWAKMSQDIPVSSFEPFAWSAAQVSDSATEDVSEPAVAEPAVADEVACVAPLSDATVVD